MNLARRGGDHLSYFIVTDLLFYDYSSDFEGQVRAGIM